MPILRVLLTSLVLLSVPLPSFADSGAPPPTDASVTTTPPDAAPTVSSTGSGSSVSPAPTPADPALPSDTDLAQDLFKAITAKDYWMIGGVMVAFVTIGVRWLLKKKWPTWDKSHYGVLLAALLAGLTAVSLAWLAGKSASSADSLMGALKLFAAATVAYVVPKSIIGGLSSTPA